MLWLGIGIGVLIGWLTVMLPIILIGAAANAFIKEGGDYFA
jgi:uncharacterized membrane protein YedE/YeeE